MRYRLARDDSFGKAAGWLYDGMASAFRSGAACLAIVGEDPNLLSGEDSAKVARANHARSIAYRPALELITDTVINWTIVASATPDWAKAVFPDLPKRKRWPGSGTQSSPHRASMAMTLSPPGPSTTPY